MRGANRSWDQLRWKAELIPDSHSVDDAFIYIYRCSYVHPCRHYIHQRRSSALTEYGKLYSMSSTSPMPRMTFWTLGHPRRHPAMFFSNATTPTPVPLTPSRTPDFQGFLGCHPLRTPAKRHLMKVQKIVFLQSFTGNKNFYDYLTELNVHQKRFIKGIKKFSIYLVWKFILTIFWNMRQANWNTNKFYKF